MVLFPVIMCGGAGTRLWPASRPSRPKQFLPLTGRRSPFQETVARVAPLVRDGGKLVVVGGLAHRDWIIDQLAELGVEAKVLLEPEGRDSAPAMAAAAVWVAGQDPEEIIAFLASDHHIPDHPAFREALLEAAGGTDTGRIVTLVEQRNYPRRQPDEQQQDRSADSQAELRLIIHQPHRRTPVLDDIRQARIVVCGHRSQQKTHIDHGDAPGRGKLTGSIESQFPRDEPANQQQGQRRRHTAQHER